ncbi:MAG TPA: prenyltransferase, partial [Micromonosporaceae bacterium]|nr:prenyltransferase [Micromonosporaceae bacterium]
MSPYHARAGALLTETAGDPFGDFSPSVYETARVVRYAPSLPGHSERLRFLLGRQRPAGEWNDPPEYALLPTLSATEALLFTIVCPRIAANPAGISDSVNRGLRRLFGWLDNGPAPDLPDTVAVEYAVPGLIAAINERLAAGLPPALAAWRGRRLAAHPAAGPEPLEALRRDTAGGTGPPATLVHSLEIFGAAARGAPGVRPRAGTVGCSPAATAAWLGDAAVRARRHPCVSYLE